MPTLTGTASNNIINGSSGDDIITGGDGTDTLNGLAGNDVISSGAAPGAYSLPNDPFPWTPPVLDTGDEQDIVSGANGDDILLVGYGDTVNGGAGIDTILISLMGATSGVTADFRSGTFYNFETETEITYTMSVSGMSITNVEYIGWIDGSNFDDTIWGSYNGWVAPIFGNGGNDIIYANWSTGHVYGGSGNDTINLGNAGRYGDKAYGEAGDDIIIGSNQSEDLFGGDGNDEISGNGYDDRIDGAFGDDILDGGSHDDTLIGAEGDDVIYGGYDTDYLDGGAGDDVIYGDSNLREPIYANQQYYADNDTIFGGAGSDIIRGENDIDILFSAGTLDGRSFGQAAIRDYAKVDDLGIENDQLFGGEGNDVLSIGVGDIADGGNGNDVLYLSLGGLTTGQNLNILDDTSNIFALSGVTLIDVERFVYLRATEFADIITANINQTNLILNGGGGDDIFIASAGNDRFIGGDGIDFVDFSLSTDRVVVDLDYDGVKRSTQGSGVDNLSGIEGIIGSDFDDRLSSSYDVAAILQGGDGNDFLTARSAGSTLEGGAGNDRYIFDSISVTITEHADGGIDEIWTTASGIVLGDHVENLRLLGSARNATGNDLNNVIRGNINVYNTIDAAGGDDRIYGGSFSNTLTGGEGNDTILGGKSGDVLYGGLDNDILNGNNGNDRLFGGAGRDFLTGGAGIDRFEFADGDFAGLTNSTADRIVDFIIGIDKIILNAVDANTNANSNQAFAFIGTDTFTNVAGQLRYEQVGNTTMVYGDTNGDGAADFAIALTGTLSLTAGDFIL